MYYIVIIVGIYCFINSDNIYLFCGFICKDGMFIFVKIFMFFVYDRIGVGDVYMSGIIYGEIKEFVLEKVVLFVLVVGMLVYIIVGDMLMLLEKDIFWVMMVLVGDVER